ncbi:MAG: YfcE family phosphodiesterase [Chloroflexota bacterium]
MRIGLLSDTHIPEAEKELPTELMEAFRGVDLILHAGDIYLPSVLDDLECIAPVLAAMGDDDYATTRTDNRVKERHILKLEGQTLWLIHERPHPLAFPPRPNRIAPEQDKCNIPDIIVFGHEHNAVVEHLDDILFINPGSPTFLHYYRGLGTIGILDITSAKTAVRILRL